jgi:hypoxanthine phosphoribosyltransferase
VTAPVLDRAQSLPHEHTAFAHESERRVAALLDFYGIEWHYEPRTFVLDEDELGVRAAFTPDFFLPAFDVYIEVTTLRQKLVTKKNRKIRLLRERHPEVRLVVLYQRDVAALLARGGAGVLVRPR